MAATATKDRIKTAEKAAHQGIDKTRTVIDENLSAAKDKVSHAAKEVRRAEGFLKEKKEHLADAARGKYEEAREGLNQKYEEAREGFHQASGKARDAARDNPALTVALAAGVGFCLGLLLARTRG